MGNSAPTQTEIAQANSVVATSAVIAHSYLDKLLRNRWGTGATKQEVDDGRQLVDLLADKNAGMTQEEISAVTGWSLYTTNKILCMLSPGYIRWEKARVNGRKIETRYSLKGYS